VSRPEGLGVGECSVDLCLGDHPRWVALAERPWPRCYDASVFEADLEVRSDAVVTDVAVTRQDATGHRVAGINHSQITMV